MAGSKEVWKIVPLLLRFLLYKIYRPERKLPLNEFYNVLDCFIASCASTAPSDQMFYMILLVTTWIRNSLIFWSASRIMKYSGTH